jgi:hypothetical protein
MSRIISAAIATATMPSLNTTLTPVTLRKTISQSFLECLVRFILSMALKLMGADDDAIAGVWAEPLDGEM